MFLTLPPPVVPLQPALWLPFHVFLTLVELQVPFPVMLSCYSSDIGAVRRLNLVLAVHTVYIWRSALAQLTGKN